MTNVLLLIAILAEVVATTALIGIAMIVGGVVMINVVSNTHGA